MSIEGMEFFPSKPINATAKIDAPIPEPDGHHYWAVMALWRVNPAHEAHLDNENLVTMRGPSCYHCSVEWPAESDICTPDDEERE